MAWRDYAFFIMLPDMKKFAVLIVTLCAAIPGTKAANPSLVEASIADIHDALRQGTTCRQIVQGYLDRIAAYDRAGAALRAVVTVNPDALRIADDLDRRYQSTHRMAPLQCVTVLVKDNIDTRDMPTTAGASAFAENRPVRDSFVVARLRAQGAVILAKANLDEFAFTYRGSSSIAGQVRNPYDLALTPGGSSSGTASGVAASFATVGLGTDTGGSGRVPASLQALVGLRPSLRLLSLDGVVPLAHSEDTVAPMCRIAQDCATLLDAMRGFDEGRDSGQQRLLATEVPRIGNTADYVRLTGKSANLAHASLRGARIGVVRALFPAADTPERVAFVATLETAMAHMREAGAVVEDVQVPELDFILKTYKTVKPFEFKGDLEHYLRRWPSDRDKHPRSLRAVMASGGHEARNTVVLAEYDVLGTSPLSHPEYVLNTTGRLPRVRSSLREALDHVDAAGNVLGPRYDALLYPTRANFNLDADGKLSNNPLTSRLSSFSGFPAISFPVAFATPPGRDKAQPIGMEMLGREFDEATLLQLVYAWQQEAARRGPPSTTPELP